MKTMTLGDSKPGYRATPTVPSSSGIAQSSCDSDGLAADGSGCVPVDHHENLTTSEAPSELRTRVVRLAVEPSALELVRALPVLPFPPAATQGCYFVRASNGLVKIGTSDDIRTRLRAVTGASPISVELVGWFECEKVIEGVMHLVLHDTRHHGEWFQPTHELLRLMEVMRSGRWRRFGGRAPVWESQHNKAQRIARALRKAVSQ